MPKTLSKNITFIIGVIAMFVAGVLYILMSDLIFGNTSTWLIIATLLSFGGAISFFFSNNFVEKPVVMYVLKALGLLLSIGFVIFIHLFQTTSFFVEKIEDFVNEGLSGEGALMATWATVYICMALGYIAVAMQATNIILVAALKEDDDIAAQKQASNEIPSEEQPSTAENQPANAE